MGDAPVFMGLLAFSLLSATIGWARVRRQKLLRQRWRTHCCLEFGYRLTGNTSGYCPECGTPDLSE